MKKNKKITNFYVIKHLSGSKANLHEIFDFGKYRELTFGRVENNLVRFDPEKDLMVSRHHAKITKSDYPLEFYLEDLGSLNGLYLNDEKVESRILITAGDRVKLGLKGPEFVFDIDPRPKITTAKQVPKVKLSKHAIEPDAALEVHSRKKEKEDNRNQLQESAVFTERERSAGVLIAAAIVTLIVLTVLSFTSRD